MCSSEAFQLVGAYERTKEVMDKIAVLNPNYPTWMNWGTAKYYLWRGEYSEAVNRLEMTGMESWYWTTAFMAAAHCADGKTELGKSSLESALEAKPNLVDVYWAEMYFWNRGPDTRPMIDAVAAGLEACGWDVPPDPGREAFATSQ